MFILHGTLASPVKPMLDCTEPVAKTESDSSLINPKTKSLNYQHPTPELHSLQP